MIEALILLITLFPQTASAVTSVQCYSFVCVADILIAVMLFGAKHFRRAMFIRVHVLKYFLFEELM